MKKERRRFTYAVLIIADIISGLGSRYYSRLFPSWTGDILWALMVFFIIGFLFKSKSSFWVAAASLTFSFSIEISQLYHSLWIDHIRATRLGGLILGYGFVWSDLLCYFIGIAVGFILEKNFFLKRTNYTDE